MPAAASTIPAADPVGGELAACFEQGLALLESQAWAPALASFSRGLEIDPGRPGLWHNRAWCHLQLGDLAAAQADLQALLEHAPGHAPGLALLGRVRLAQGAIEEGSRLLDLAWMADPADPDIARQALQALLLRPDGESAARTDHHRVTIRRGLGDILRADVAVGATAIVDHHRDAEALAHFLRQRARGHVDGATGWEGHDDAYRLGGKILREGDGRCGTGGDQHAQVNRLDHKNSFELKGKNGEVVILSQVTVFK